uniref:Major sperm protein n=1 Tax=Mesocestoides corti TaxID=53468 RepID=A0A5K3FV43_MESCO
MRSSHIQTSHRPRFTVPHRTRGGVCSSIHVHVPRSTLIPPIWHLLPIWTSSTFTQTGEEADSMKLASSGVDWGRGGKLVHQGPMPEAPIPFPLPISRHLVRVTQGKVRLFNTTTSIVRTRVSAHRVDDIQFVSGYNITLCIRPDEKQLMTRGQKTYPLTHLFQVSRTIQEVSFEDLAALPRTLWKRVKYPEVYRTYPQDVSMNQIVKAVKAGLAVTDVRLHFYLKNRICHIMRKMISFQANDKINLLWIYLVIFIHLPDATVQFPHPHSANQHDSLFA